MTTAKGTIYLLFAGNLTPFSFSSLTVLLDSILKPPLAVLQPHPCSLRLPTVPSQPRLRLLNHNSQSMILLTYFRVSSFSELIIHSIRFIFLPFVYLSSYLSTKSIIDHIYRYCKSIIEKSKVFFN